MTWDLSCQNWAERIRAGRPLIPSLPLFRENADRGLAVFKKLRLADVPGNPLLRDACGQWFFDIVEVLHGSLDPATGERLVRELIVLVPKKSSKTTNSALLMLTSLLVNRRPKALFLLVAPTLDVTQIAFSQIEGAIRLDAELSEMLHIQTHIRKITDRSNGATLQVLSFAPEILTGQKCAGVLLDETHVIASNAKSASCLVQLRGSLTAYPEAFMMQITTQSEVAPSGVFRSELMRARAVRDGRQTGKLLPVLYEFPPDIATDRSKWSNPSCWRMVLPNLGRSVKLDRLIEDFETVKEGDEAELRRWASQFLNIEIGLGLLSDRWVGASYWEAAGDPTLTLDEIIRRSEVLVAAIDGGGLDDLLGAAVLGRDAQTRHWLLTNHAWCHTDVLERRKSEVGRLKDFERDGDLTIVDKLPDDIGQLADGIAQLYETGKLVGVALDQLGLGGIVEALLGRGIPREMIVPVSQGYKLNAAIKTAERKLADGTLIHSAQRLMSWAIGNAKTEMRGNATLITKAASGTAKIDPVMAMLAAVHVMSTSAETGAIYSDGRPLLVI
jgi:phage terminase large subunit-like protein